MAALSWFQKGVKRILVFLTNIRNKTITHYSQHAQRYCSLYDSLSAEKVHADWSSVLETLSPGKALDVGAGSGRDAHWLAQKGWCVVAAEPADELRELAQANTSNDIQWYDALLPDLAGLHANLGPFDLILLSAVWMHLPTIDRPMALKQLATRLSASGRMYISLRFGPSDDERPMYPVSFDELHQLAAENGLTARCLNTIPNDDWLQRGEISWVTVQLTAANS